MWIANRLPFAERKPILSKLRAIIYRYSRITECRFYRNPQITSNRHGAYLNQTPKTFRAPPLTSPPFSKEGLGEECKNKFLQFHKGKLGAWGWVKIAHAPNGRDRQPRTAEKGINLRTKKTPRCQTTSGCFFQMLCLTLVGHNIQHERIR